MIENTIGILFSPNQNWLSIPFLREEEEQEFIVREKTFVMKYKGYFLPSCRDFMLVVPFFQKRFPNRELRKQRPNTKPDCGCCMLTAEKGCFHTSLVSVYGASVNGGYWQ